MKYLDLKTIIFIFILCSNLFKAIIHGRLLNLSASNFKYIDERNPFKWKIINVRIITLTFTFFIFSDLFHLIWLLKFRRLHNLE